MQKILEVTYPRIRDFADAMGALEKAAVAHANHLGVGFDAMLGNYGVLWMIARSRVRLDRLPEGEVRVRTWLRAPSAAMSIRDYALLDGEEEIGSGLQYWVLADAEKRNIVNMKTIPPIWESPYVENGRTETLRRLVLPELVPVEKWQVSEKDLDKNGHLNNVHYVQHGQVYAPPGAKTLDIYFDRECLCGEVLTLEAADGFVRGVKEDGDVSFHARFY